MSSPRDGIDVAVACRVLQGVQVGLLRLAAPAAVDPRCRRRLADQHDRRRCTPTRACSYGSPRVHAELRLGLGVRCGRKRVARLMREAGIAGICHRAQAGRTPAGAGGPRRPGATAGSSPTPRTGCGAPTSPSTPPATARSTWPRCSDVLHPPDRRLVDRRPHAHRARRRRPADGHLATTAGARRPWSTRDRGSQYTSWVFGHRLRAAGLLGSMGRVASSVDNTMMESFFSTLQRELLDTRRWDTRAELGSAIFEWIEGWYNPRRRHTALGTSPRSTTKHLATADPFHCRRTRRHDHHTVRVRTGGSGSDRFGSGSRACA